MTRALHAAACTSLMALIALCIAWEWLLAPLRPGGSWLVLKALPLVLPLPGIMQGRRYTYQWTALLALAYFVEGIVRAYSESGTAATLAVIEIALALVFFSAAFFYLRLTAGRSRG
jgi:uncharacterized membrane protein